MTAVLYPYQQDALEFLDMRNGCAGLFMEMRTGKTRVVLSYIKRRKFKRVLVVSPITPASVWQAEANELRMKFVIINLTTGGTGMRAQMVDHWRRMAIPDKKRGLYAITDTVIIVVNHESFWRQPLRRQLLKWVPQAVVIDEAHKIKGRSTHQSRFAHQLAQQPFVSARIAMTGTPIGNGYEDLYSIYKFVDPTVFGTVWSQFENKYIVKGGYGGYTIKEYLHIDEIEAKLEETAFQKSRSEALGQAPPEEIIIPIELSNKLRKQYDAFKKNAIAEIEGLGPDGKPKKGIALASIVLTTIMRLQQMTGGFVTTTENELLDISDEKIKATLELVQDAYANNQQVVVFCRFRHDINRLRKVLPGPGAVLWGSMKQTARDKARTGLAEGRLRILLVQIQTGSLGIDLASANVAIFYSTGYSLIDFVQARDRLQGPKQERIVTNYYLVGKNTVDEKIIKALRDKQSVAGKVTKLDYARQLFS